MRRMDRYNDEYNVQISRADKNQELYQNISNNSKYTNITDVTNANAFEIKNTSHSNNYKSREAYQQMKKYQNIEPVPRVKKELEDFNYLYQQKENKVYDINSVLEEARKNRQEKDALEEKRKLKNTSYNILAGLNLEELEKYREEKKNRLRQPDDEIRELIDTITSKTLAGEIDKATSVDLLSDLMATNILDKVEKPSEIEDKEETIDEKLSLSKEILDQDQIKELEKRKEERVELTNPNLKDADSDFYTRSMDLSDKDFEMSDEFKEKKLPLGVKILIFILIVALISVAAYFIYKRI